MVLKQNQNLFFLMLLSVFSVSSSERSERVVLSGLLNH